ncbi:ribose-phosphate pyrophosphokinase [Petrotoga sp. HKA.pet.4.5]|jgi:ribose-phosphate pyrophosphokinase|uniref:ribose-phosphate pyrophosphokinase n=1 Tax=unclassified Petrotoga TaxID=2620614 RepID=UPI000CB90ADB|nr:MULTISPECIES: ribose-phosphate pyrophosphokinase [unclassified Petrotoga]PNR90101.1 ribose-phosphate pyrophosphokinase [Petrotoga sp. 9T1HF07.CasAA.8.2]RLL85405.1 ribose-phosphate pyrophosphokinase [Petrotoga sp. Shatin.DS.tank11.9.2.9.3]RLL89008.1 ribose-phosphate pyrophosphokinase [Petrotoga sp. HKA.pet.4.5]
MPTNENQFKVFAGNSNPPLAKKIVEYMGTRLGDCEVSTFADGEVNVKINETVRGFDVYIIQSIAPPVNNNIMELLIMIDALRRASAASISAIIPYFGYARQDRKARGRDPITAKLVANLITTAGATRVVTIDLHAEQIQGFFDIPVDNLWSFPIFSRYFLEEMKLTQNETVVVSPDVGGVKRARKFAQKLGCSLAILDKRRPKDNVAEVINVIGEVEGSNCIIFDDIIDTGGSLVAAAETLHNKGAKKIIAAATHGIFSLNAVEKLQNSSIDKIIVTDTIYHKELPDKFVELKSSELLGEAIVRIRKNLSVSILFR